MKLPDKLNYTAQRIDGSGPGEWIIVWLNHLGQWRLIYKHKGAYTENMYHDEALEDEPLWSTIQKMHIESWNVLVGNSGSTTD